MNEKHSCRILPKNQTAVLPAQQVLLLLASAQSRVHTELQCVGMHLFITCNQSAWWEQDQEHS